MRGAAPASERPDAARISRALVRLTTAVTTKAPRPLSADQRIVIVVRFDRPNGGHPRASSEGQGERRRGRGPWPWAGGAGLPAGLVEAVAGALSGGLERRSGDLGSADDAGEVRGFELPWVAGNAGEKEEKEQSTLP
jgi:hypothetical protein